MACAPSPCSTPTTFWMARDGLRSAGARSKASSSDLLPLIPRRGPGISYMKGRHKLKDLLMSIRLHKIVLFTLLFGVFAGCVPSWNPLYTQKDLVVDPQLVGTWKGDEGETWKFEKTGDKKYKLVYTDAEGKATFAAHLLKINDRQFLDLFLHDSAAEDIK